MTRQIFCRKYQTEMEGLDFAPFPGAKGQEQENVLLLGDGVVNLGYRYRRNLLEQADLSFLYPINPTWSVVGRYYHSIDDDKLLEAIGGVQWDSCCLAVRVLARRHVRNREGEMDNGI